MIQFTHETTRYTVKPETALKLRALLDKPKKHKFIGLTPVKRDYPVFYQGMSTSDYVSLFNRQFDGVQHKITHECPRYHMPAPMLDGSIPECVEDVNPDYVEPVSTFKRKPATATQLRKALENIAAIEPATTANTHDLWLAIGEMQRIAKGVLNEGP